MSWWTIEPRDPVMIRDGRPFGLDTEGARSLDFPTPSAVAGTLRSRIGFEVGGGARFALTPTDALGIASTGPVLVEIAQESRLWLPAPRDCVLFDGGPAGWQRYRLAPGERWSEDSSLPQGLRPVEPVTALPEGKPAKDPPAFWGGAEFQRWSSEPAAADLLPRTAGRPPLVHERRTHVAIDPQTGTGLDGKLFQTDGLRLTTRTDGCWRQYETGWRRDADAWHRLVFAVHCPDPRLRSGTATLGGERRLSLLEPAGPEVACLLEGWTPPDLRGERRARVTLLTPAVFREGSTPSVIRGARVVAAAVGRPQTVSGWDMARKNRDGTMGAPKATRRCAPVGSVYWVELAEGLDPHAWATAVHLRSVSDAEQDQRDGFGLAAVGVW